MVINDWTPPFFSNVRAHGRVVVLPVPKQMMMLWKWTSDEEGEKMLLILMRTSACGRTQESGCVHALHKHHSQDLHRLQCVLGKEHTHQDDF